MRDMKTEVATEKVTLTTTTVAEIVFNGDKDICNEIKVTLTVTKKDTEKSNKDSQWSNSDWDRDSKKNRENDNDNAGDTNTDSVNES